MSGYRDSLSDFAPSSSGELELEKKTWWRGKAWEGEAWEERVASKNLSNRAKVNAEGDAEGGRSKGGSIRKLPSPLATSSPQATLGTGAAALRAQCHPWMTVLLETMRDPHRVWGCGEVASR